MTGFTTLSLSTITALLLSALPQVAVGQGIPPSTATKATHLAALLDFQIPGLPDLGEPERYLPAAESPLRLVIRLQERQVYLYRSDQLIVSYPIAVGKQGWETPIGTFEVLQKFRDPAWEHPWTGEIVPPGPDNPLGDRWIGFWTDGKNFIGFHGTPNEELVGQAVSHGCIRMRNRDVRTLFEQVALGTPVKVEP